MIKYKGLSIITSRGVYEPAEDTFLAAEAVELEVGKLRGKDLSVLDMGSGTGILGLVAACSAKVKHVTFADITPRAIAICNDNISFNSATVKAKCTAVESDLFSKIDGKFDIIIFNAPYLKHDKDEDNSIDLVGGNKGIEISQRFIDECVSHMKDGARIILVASSLSDIDALKNHIAKKGLKIHSSTKIHIFFEDIVAFIIAKG